LNEGYYYDAIKDLNRSIELNPEDEYSYIYRGLSNVSIKNYKAATKDFKYALELDPGNEDFIQYIEQSEQSE